MLADRTVLQNRYRILFLPGQGGMGAVYKAWDMRLNIPAIRQGMGWATDTGSIYVFTKDGI